MAFRLELTPTDSAEAALRSILHRLATDVRSRVPDILEDRDPEHLHDLRVAARRTRSALSQLKGILPFDELKPFRAEFKWLGNLTGPLRDLDVLKLDLATPTLDVVEEGADSNSLMELVSAARARAHRTVCSALRSSRFASLMSEWPTYLEGSTPPEKRPPRADQPILDVASVRILKAHRRVLRRGSKLGEVPARDDLHRLRIDAKKLRYLLEFFCSLYPEAEIVALIRELKALQDMLGAVNDTAVQRDLVASLADKASPEGKRSAVRVSRRLTDRQRRAVESFAAAFATFANPESQARYEALFAPRPPGAGTASRDSVS